MRYSSPPDPKAFAERVYAIVRLIPRGRVMTYGQVAQQILPPASVPVDQYLRAAPIWVGGAMANAPDDVPWQRVINSQGKVSERPGLGPAVQRQMLEREGVVFDARDRVDLKRYGWNGPDAPEPEQPSLL